MKKLIIPILILTAAVVFAATNIEWNVGGKPVYAYVSRDMTTGTDTIVHFGLRSDGVVVWRKISTSTNSPAESLEYGTLEFGGIIITNVLLTNAIVPFFWEDSLTNPMP